MTGGLGGQALSPQFFLLFKTLYGSAAPWRSTASAAALYPASA